MWKSTTSCLLLLAVSYSFAFSPSLNRRTPVFHRLASTTLFGEETTVEAPTGEDASPSPEEAPEEEPKRIIARERHTAFVGNLPFTTTEEEIVELFSKFCKVELVNIPKDRQSNRPRGFAFVDVESNEALETAVTALDSQDFNGRVLRVNKSVPKDKIPPKADKATDNTGKIYVGNLSFEITNEAVVECYEQFGEVVDVYVPTDPNTGKARGFAFVTMKTEEEAVKAIEESTGLELEGRPIVASKPLSPGEKREKRPRLTKMYVGNLSFYTVVETLWSVFEEFGTVHDCYLPLDSETGSSRGFAFVTMENEAAKQAIDEIDGCEIDGRVIRVNEAQPKGSSSRAANNDDDEEAADDEEINL